MNKIALTGRLAADPELRHAASTSVLNFRVASDVGFGDKKSTNWFACAVFGKRADSLSSHLAKGQEVTVFGTLTLREWADRDGIKRLSPDVAVDDIQMHGGAKGQQQQQQQDDSSDIPF